MTYPEETPPNKADHVWVTHPHKVVLWLLVSPAAQGLLVLSTFSSSSPVSGQEKEQLLAVCWIQSLPPTLPLSALRVFAFPLSLSVTGNPLLFLPVSLLFSWPGSLPLLKGFLKPSSQIRRRAVATGSYFRCLTNSVKGIMRSLQAWPFASMSRKGLWVCSFPIISLPAPTLRGVGWRSCYWPV